MPAARAEARIKQLCCLGLGGQALVPALLREIHSLVPSHANAFYWIDENYRVTNLYSESPMATTIAPLYLSEYHNKRECEVYGGLSAAIRRPATVLGFDDLLRVSRRELYMHDFYNIVLRELEYHDFRRVKIQEHGHPLGALMVYRSKGEVPFSVQDNRALASIAPYIAHGLQITDEWQGPMSDSGESGVCIIDRHGKLQHVSPQAYKLLFMAAHEEISTRTSGPLRNELTLPPRVSQLYKKLTAVFESGGSVEVPVCQHKNAWGVFTFRAHWLQDARPDGMPLIAITIQQQEPLPVKLMRQMQGLPLSPRQMQICLLLCSGHSHQKIAQQTGISEHTVIAHSRQIYTKLDVHNRADLVNKLLLMPEHQATFLT